MRTQKKKNASGGNIEYPSDAFSNSKSLKLEQQMGNRADDCQGNNGSLQEDEEQFEQVDRQLGAENQSAYFVQEKYLGYGNHRNDEPSHWNRIGARDDYRWGEHIGEADHHGGSRRSDIRHLQGAEKRTERHAQPVEDRSVVGHHKGCGTDAHNGWQDAEPHVQAVFCAVSEEFANTFVGCGSFHSQVQAVLFRRSKTFRQRFRHGFARNQVIVRLFPQWIDSRTDYRADDSNQADY